MFLVVVYTFKEIGSLQCAPNSGGKAWGRESKTQEKHIQSFY